MPRVTIAIPVYNKGKYLAETIASAVAQTYTDVEILILDNCSTDDSWSIIESFTDPRIRKIRWPENIGRAANFNSAFELAEGEFVKILDADDLLKPECVAAQVRAFDEAPPDAVMGVVRHDFVSSKGRTLLRSKGVHGLAGYYSGREAADISIRAAGNLFGTESSSLLRTTAARKVTWREADLESRSLPSPVRFRRSRRRAAELDQGPLERRFAQFQERGRVWAQATQRSVSELIGSGAFPGLEPLTKRERLKTSFHVSDVSHAAVGWHPSLTVARHGRTLVCSRDEIRIAMSIGLTSGDHARRARRSRRPPSNSSANAVLLAKCRHSSNQRLPSRPP